MKDPSASAMYARPQAREERRRPARRRGGDDDADGLGTTRSVYASLRQQTFAQIICTRGKPDLTISLAGAFGALLGVALTLVAVRLRKRA
jgi:hypothetical protein